MYLISQWILLWSWIGLATMAITNKGMAVCNQVEKLWDKAVSVDAICEVNRQTSPWTKDFLLWADGYECELKKD